MLSWLIVGGGPAAGGSHAEPGGRLAVAVHKKETRGPMLPTNRQSAQSSLHGALGFHSFSAACS